MQKRDALSDCHPLVGAAYFAVVLAFSMVLMHPASVLSSLAGALGYAFCLRGRAALRTLARLAPFAALAAVLNAAFNHAGVTILGYFPSGNPLTAESLWYALGAAGMLAAVLLWLSCCGEVLTSDKLLWLFGRLSPHLALLLSMTLRFVPRFSAHLRAVREAQRCLSGEESGFRGALRAFSGSVTWALENGVETADSMRDRGYGSAGRTAYSLYRIDRRDRRLLVLLGLCAAWLTLAALRGFLRWRYFPYLTGAPLAWGSILAQLAYAALCFFPAILHGKEALVWKRLRSAI